MYIYLKKKKKIRLSQNKINKRDMVRQNTFSYIITSFSQLRLYQIQETGRALFNYNIINIFKRQLKFFKSFTVLRKFELTFQFWPVSCLGENNSHPWLPVREVTRTRSAKIYSTRFCPCLLIMRICKFRKE